MAVFTYFGVISMTNHQFAMFFVFLLAIGLPSVSLLFAGAYDIWQYAKGCNNERSDSDSSRGQHGPDHLVVMF